jgi:DNA-binding transcriptional ArsR family regulator
MPRLKNNKQSDLDIVKTYKALSDKTRLGIALNLSSSKKELTCSELASRFDLSQPAFSHHCQKLVQAGILNMRKEGATHYLSLNEENLQKFGIDLTKLW